MQSDWTTIEILPSTEERRSAWLRALESSESGDTVEALSNFLPSLLARRDATVLRILARYLVSPDSLKRTYAAYALNYFEPDLLRRVVPKHQPLRGSVR